MKLVFLPPLSATLHDWSERIAAAVPGTDIALAADAAAARREIADADAAYGRLTPELLAAAPRLRWLQAPAANPSPGFFFPELVAHPLVVTNMRGVYNDHIAAHILAFVLAFARGLHHYIPQQLHHIWKRPPQDTGTVHLPDATLLIVGMGGIGRETARLAAAFGLTVIGIDIGRLPPVAGVAEMHPVEALDAQLPRGDFVVLTVPHTLATESMMDAARFRRMKRGAFFINVGRGRTARLDDLVAVLADGHLGGAGLDVFEEEPLPEAHPLWSAPNVLLTPHTAGYGPYREARFFDILLDNCRSFLRGATLRNVVDKASGV